jgi:hypothetical protein
MLSKMTSKLKFILFFIPLLLLVFSSRGQNKVTVDSTKVKSKSIHLIGKSLGDSVVLRWAPSSPVYWSSYNKSGYVIERYEVEPNKLPKNPARTALSSSPIKPWTLEEWKKKASPQDSSAAIVAQLLYGKGNAPVVKKDSKSKSTDVDLIRL